MHNPLIRRRYVFSVITVSFNNAATIQQTIESVLGQTYEDIEYLVIDGGSTDGTVEILQSYGDRIRWISEPDEGLYFAMNKGWKMATGDFIGYLNADDFYNSKKGIASLVKALRVSPEIWVLYADLAYVKADNTDEIVRYWKAGPYNRYSFLFGWMPPHPTFFVRKAAFEVFGGFRAYDLRSAADYELMLRMLYRQRLPALYVPELLVRMRVGGVSNKSFLNRLRGNREDRKAWRLNGMRAWFFTMILKPLRKISQFVQRPEPMDDEDDDD